MIANNLMTTYPKDVYLQDYSTRVILRPMEQGDGQDLLAFFSRIPIEELYCLKDDVSSPDMILRRANWLDYD